VSVRLVLVRHGESTSNTGRIATSARSGYPLTERGRRQAARLAETLAETASPGHPAAIQRVYSSTIQRARQTAQVIGGRLGTPVSVVAGLEEIHVGVFEGMSEDDPALDGATNFRRWLRHGDLDHGFDGGETARAVAIRVSAALVDLADRHEGEEIAVVSHGGALVLGLSRLCWNLAPTFVADHLLDNCDSVVVEVDGADWTCLRWASAPLTIDTAGERTA
jgi:broad specificity phosphatase PhoE